MSEQPDQSHAAFGLIVTALLCILLSFFVLSPFSPTYEAYIFNSLLGGASLVLVFESLHRARGADRVLAWLGGAVVVVYLLWELYYAVPAILEFLRSG